MLTGLLSKLPVPRPADWGFKVSVCIALLCNERKTIVRVSDYKVNFGEFAADNMAAKGHPTLLP